MVDPALLNFPRPATFVEPEGVEVERRRKLKELVWDRIPKRLIEQPIREEFRSLVDSFDWGVSWILLGHTGSGKSTACVHLVRELLRRGVTHGGKDFDAAKGIFWTRADEITAAGAEKTDEATKLIHRAQHSKLMILDDVSEAQKTLLRVIQQRYDRGKPVIVTSGALSAKELSEKVGGDAVVRWLLECGGARKGVILTAKSAHSANAGVRPFPRPTPGTTPTLTRQTSTTTRNQ